MGGLRASCKPLECLIILLLLFNRVVCSKGPSSPDRKTPARSKSSQRQWNWNLLLNNTGVVAMHMAVTHHNKVVIFDQTDAGPSQYRFRKCKTRGGSGESACYAHSVEYNVLKNKVRALHLTTDTWCSSGSFLSNGTLLQTGGNGSGSKKIRYYKPCKNGRILVAGGNPNHRYIMHGVTHPTELRLQALTPDYMSERFDHLRPKDVKVIYPRKAHGVENGHIFNVSFSLGTETGNLSVVAYAPPFATHSLSMNQRMVRLECLGWESGDGHDRFQASVVAPPSIYVAPPGYYMLTVVNGGVPSRSSWLRIL
ncbi:hypothetical protein L1887_20177 [Cichorium endivia]|nr:hypothetical protein L1887_20177 [Cichorium endivia]